MALEESKRIADGVYRVARDEHDRIIRMSRVASPDMLWSVSGGTQTLEYMLRRNIESFQAGIGQTLSGALVVSMQEILNKSIPMVGAATQSLFNKMAASTKEQVDRKDGMFRMHEKVMGETKKRVIRRYRDKIANTPHPSYRAGRNRLPGVMIKALNNPQVWRAQRDGVIIDGGLLDRTAKHWRRLNFGAGKEGRSSRAQSAPLRLDNKRIGGAYLNFGIGPSPDFYMPPGLWFDTGGTGHFPDRAVNRGSQDPRFHNKKDPRYGRSALGHEFYPLGVGKGDISSFDDDRRKKALRAAFQGGGPGGRRPTRGIRATHFMQSGLFYLATTLPGEYKKLGEQWLHAALQSKGPFYKAGFT